MSTCPAGHDSGDSEYCETCGIRMSTTSGASVSGGPSGRSVTSATAVLGVISEESTLACPECGERLVDRFCEGCGFDTLHLQGRPPPTQQIPEPTTSSPLWTGQGVDWLAVVSADRAYYERLMAETGSDPAALPYPPYHPERQYPLTQRFLRIGRRSVGRGIHPDIDLSLPPEDPAVSHEHALLLAKPDNTWSLVDLGATNGTLVNDDPEPITPHIEVPLQHGDRIYLGAWTVITILKG